MINLANYSGKKICVAVSGGRDSMALMHYLKNNAETLSITLSALNCDHSVRGESSKRDSNFVKDYCESNGIPLAFFKRKDNLADKSEEACRKWRLACYVSAIENFSSLKPTAVYGNFTAPDFIATAHHMGDNAETVLFNIARGSGSSGLCGICDGKQIIHPLICCTREQIDGYISKNSIPYVDDETNFTDCYTRNKIRRNVIPALEEAVPGAQKAIYRLSRIIGEDEEYFRQEIADRKLITFIDGGFKIAFCDKKALFKRACVYALSDLGISDYTFEHIERLYGLQNLENGRKFEFLGFTAYSEDSVISVVKTRAKESLEIAFKEYAGETFCGEKLIISNEKKCNSGEKLLAFDPLKIPETAVIRFKRDGDRFEKFGGGTKKLGDFFTDRKIPVRLRKKIPLIAEGSEIFAVCGVEISDKIKITDSTKKINYLICADYSAK